MADPNDARLNASTFLAVLAERMELLLNEQDDPRSLLAEILDDAESAGIIDAAGAIRKRPDLFVTDLLLENPRAFEWAQVARDYVDPRSIEDESELLDAIWQPK